MPAVKALLAMVAVALSGTPASDRADMAEAACVSAMADRLTIDVSQFVTLGSKRVGKATRVTLKAEGRTWRCHISDVGEITDVQEVTKRR